MLWWMLFTLLALGAGGTAYGVHWYRHRRRLETLASQHKMQRPSSGAVDEVLTSLPEDWGKAGFREPLMGRDGSGRYLSARRGRGHHAEEIFLAELSRHTPARGLALLSETGSGGEELQMRWNLTPDQALDAQSREIVQRVLREFAAFKIQHAAMQISLEIGDRGAIIHAPQRGDESRNEFLAAARVLRRDLLHCLYRRGPTIEKPQAAPNAEAPAKEMPAPPAPRREELPQDAEVDRALENIEAQPMVSIQDLVAEKPAPPRRKGWRRVGYREVFEVPEPEDRVEIISAQASSTKPKKLLEDAQEKTKVITFLP